MSRFTMIILLSILSLPGRLSASDHPLERAGQGARILTLREAIRMALDRAPELALARSESDRAADALRETRSLNLPQVVTGTGLAYNNGFPLSLEGSAPSVIQLGISQAILSKKNKNLILEAEEGRKASDLGLAATRDELVARVALLYHELHLAGEFSRLWSARLDSARRQQQLMEALFEAGKARPLDLTLAAAETAAAEHQLLVAAEQARFAESALKQAVGHQDEAAIATVEPQMDTDLLEAPLGTLYQRALESNPGIQQAEANVRGKEFHLEAEKGEYYPRLDLIGQYAVFSRFNNYQDYFNRFSRNNYIVGMSIQVPIFNGFRTSARVAQGRKEVSEARLRLQSLKNELRLGVERLAGQLRVARGAVNLARLEMAAARENLQISQLLLEAGRLSARELESLRVRTQEKEIALIEARKTLWQRQVELLRLTNSMTTLY